jgi:hypothetical protein
MYRTEPTVPSITYVLKKISDDKALVLFNNIALSKDNSHIPLKDMNLSTKQVNLCRINKKETRSVLSYYPREGGLQCPNSHW